MITIGQIQQTVAHYFGIEPIEMSSARRARYVARPRQVAIYFSRAMTKRSLPEIGRAFGHRDHTTVIHACEKVTYLRDHDAAFATAIVELDLRLKQLDETGGLLDSDAYELIVDRVCADMRRLLLATRPKFPARILEPIAAAFAIEEEKP